MDENNTQPNNNGNLKTVRTYLSDMADTVRQNQISVIKVALAEQNRNERENVYRQVETSPIKKVLWIIGGVILIGASIFGIYFLINKKAQDAVVPVAKEETIISYDEVAPIDNTDNLVDKINIIKKDVSSSKVGNIKFITLSQNINGVKEKVSVKNLFSLLNFSASPSLVRALSDSYMIGTYTTDKPHLFIILQVQDYNYAYAGMLDWESSLANNVMPLFQLDTNENKLQLNNRKWSDLIVENKDTRALLNENGKTILYYLFNNKDNLIITDDESTVKEIISKLIIKNIKPL